MRGRGTPQIAVNHHKALKQRTTGPQGPQGPWARKTTGPKDRLNEENKEKHTHTGLLSEHPYINVIMMTAVRTDIAMFNYVAT